jgi:hypothetical protein
LLCRVLDLRYLDRSEGLLFLWLLLESGVCVLWSSGRRLGSVGDGVEVLIFLCVGRGKVPWLWSLGLLQSVKKRWSREGSEKEDTGILDWLSLFFYLRQRFLPMSPSDLTETNIRLVFSLLSRYRCYQTGREDGIKSLCMPCLSRRRISRQRNHSI